MATFKNSVQLLGRLGADAVIRTSVNGSNYCMVNLATNISRKKGNGEQLQVTHWHTITIWGPLCEEMRKYGTKGSLWLIQGILTNRKYEDREGETKYKCEVRADMLMYLAPASIGNQATV